MYAQVLPFVSRSNLHLPSEDAVNDNMVSRQRKMLGIDECEKLNLKGRSPRKAPGNKSSNSSTTIYPNSKCAHTDAVFQRSRDLCTRSEIESIRPYNAVVTDLPIPAFSFIILGLNVAS